MGTAIVLIILAAIIAAILFFMVKKKKSGKPSCSECGTGCSGCSAKDYCESKDELDDVKKTNGR